tara:strand:+ start:266 stop:898 length:633 start_codon:yes stop_codon:yes gene_type:complete
VIVEDENDIPCILLECSGPGLITLGLFLPLDGFGEVRLPSRESPSCVEADMDMMFPVLTVAPVLEEDAKDMGDPAWPGPLSPSSVRFKSPTGNSYMELLWLCVERGELEKDEQDGILGWPSLPTEVGLLLLFIVQLFVFGEAEELLLTSVVPCCTMCPGKSSMHVTGECARLLLACGKCSRRDGGNIAALSTTSSDTSCEFCKGESPDSG